MADTFIDILTPGTSFDFMTLEEAKTWANTPLTDTSGDAQLQMFIDVNSAVIMRRCNRIFAYEEVYEEWRELNGGTRIFPSHYPIVAADIESVESPIGTLLDPSAYELEPVSGKVELISSGGLGSPWIEPVSIKYWGGYNLPAEAPLPLKQVLVMLNLQSKMLASIGPVAGFRTLSHKEARVQFQDPAKLMSAVFGAGGGMQPAIDELLSHYIRIEV
jgi:hypothetical protein